MIDRELAHYRIVEKLGEGGMGSVWKALDTTLDREVAIKVLPPAVSQDAEHLARFGREAKLLASLNHPNIATVHGLHEAEGVHFLAMELVAGEDLSRRLARGALPVPEALTAARQIAHALEVAHEHGVIHRDLKPANIQAMPDGRVKVLDFGLAKAMETGALTSDASPTHSPTVTSAGTRTGTILGTAAYMSPEQARGKPLDRRTDIWSFGCVLYECLTGASPFRGETVTDSLGAILHKEPDLKLLPGDTPPSIRRLLQRCLVKDPANRMRDIGDARIELDQVLSGVAEIAEPDDTAAPQAARRLSPATAIALILGGAVLGAALWGLFGPSRSPRETSAPVTRLSFAVPPNQELRGVRISPDGRTIVYEARNTAPGEGQDGKRRLWVRPLASVEARPVPGSEDVHWFTFSPDGRWLAFGVTAGPSDVEIRKVLLENPVPVSLVEGAERNWWRGGAWLADDTLLYFAADTLWRVPVSGGTPETLIEDVGEGKPAVVSSLFPLPDGEGVLMGVAHVVGDGISSRVEVLELASLERTVLVPEGWGPGYASTGHLLFGREESVLAAPFDAATRELTGPEAPVMKDLPGPSHFSSNGTWIQAPDRRTRDRGLVLGPEGEIEGPDLLAPFVDDERRVFGLRWSPDGSRLAVRTLERGRAQLWIHEPARDLLLELPFDGGFVGWPIWTPDGESLVFKVTPPDKSSRIYTRRATGGGTPTVLHDPGDPEIGAAPGDYSPDSAWLAYVRSEQDNEDIWLLPTAEEDEPRPFVTGPGADDYPRFSPDGRWLAFESDESGLSQVYVSPFTPDSGEDVESRVRISSEQGQRPVWSRDGRQIFFQGSGWSLLAATVEAVPGRTAIRLTGNPRVVADLTDRHVRGELDLHPVSGELLMVEVVPLSTEENEIQVVLHWFTELEAQLRAAGR